MELRGVYSCLEKDRGFQNPKGTGEGYGRVGVRVRKLLPSTNPYPWWGYRGYRSYQRGIVRHTIVQLTNICLRLAYYSLQCNDSAHCQYQCKYSSYEYSAALPEVVGEEEELGQDWDAIVVDLDT